MPAPAPISERSRRATLTVAITAIAIETALLGVVAPLLPEIERRTGAGDEALGLALAAYAIPVMLISIPIGRVADRIGRRPLLLGGLLLTGAGSILIAVSGALEPFLIGRAVQGVGSALSWISALALVSDLARPGRKGEAIGFALAANSLGSIGGPALGGIAGGAISFEAPFILVAALSVTIFTVGFFVLPRSRPTATVEAAPKVPLLPTLLRRSALMPGAVAIMGAATLGLIDFVLPLDLDRSLGTSATTIGLMFAAVAIIDAIVAPIAGRVSDSRGRRPVAFAGAVAIAGSGLLLALLGGLAGAAIGLGVLAIGIAITFAGTIPWLDEAYGAVDRGLAYGGLNLVYSIGYTIGPLLGGWLLGSSGADSAYVAIAIAAGAIAIAIAIHRPGAVGAEEEGRKPQTAQV